MSFESALTEKNLGSFYKIHYGNIVKISHLKMKLQSKRVVLVKPRRTRSIDKLNVDSIKISKTFSNSLLLFRTRRKLKHIVYKQSRTNIDLSNKIQQIKIKSSHPTFCSRLYRECTCIVQGNTEICVQCSQFELLVTTAYTHTIHGHSVHCAGHRTQ